MSLKSKNLDVYTYNIIKKTKIETLSISEQPLLDWCLIFMDVLLLFMWDLTCGEQGKSLLCSFNSWGKAKACTFPIACFQLKTCMGSLAVLPSDDMFLYFSWGLWYLPKIWFLMSSITCYSFSWYTCFIHWLKLLSVTVV